MFKFLSAFKPIFNFINQITKNDELNRMVQESTDSKELLTKALMKVIEKTEDK